MIEVGIEKLAYLLSLQKKIVNSMRSIWGVGKEGRILGRTRNLSARGESQEREAQEVHEHYRTLRLNAFFRIFQTLQLRLSSACLLISFADFGTQ
jgi:hypothetical protein